MKKNENGRSMVEMLGVLAIVGVLSVAGIAGYSMAMRNYRANEIVNAASMFYVLAKAQNQGNGPSDNTDYETLGGTNPSGATLAYTDNAFTITFTDPDDCTMAANKLGDKATADCTNKKLTVNFGETTSTPPTPTVACPYGMEDIHTVGECFCDGTEYPFNSPDERLCCPPNEHLKCYDTTSSGICCDGECISD